MDLCVIYTEVHAAFKPARRPWLIPRLVVGQVYGCRDKDIAHHERTGRLISDNALLSSACCMR